MGAALTMARSIVSNNGLGVWQTRIRPTPLDAPSLRTAIEIENRTVRLLPGHHTTPGGRQSASEKRPPCGYSLTR